MCQFTLPPIVRERPCLLIDQNRCHQIFKYLPVWKMGWGGNVVCFNFHCSNFSWDWAFFFMGLLNTFAIDCLWISLMDYSTNLIFSLQCPACCKYNSQFIPCLLMFVCTSPSTDRLNQQKVHRQSQMDKLYPIKNVEVCNIWKIKEKLLPISLQ
jgi:hypothetical protein